MVRLFGPRYEERIPAFASVLSFTVFKTFNKKWIVEDGQKWGDLFIDYEEFGRAREKSPRLIEGTGPWKAKNLMAGRKDREFQSAEELMWISVPMTRIDDFLKLADEQPVADRRKKGSKDDEVKRWYQAGFLIVSVLTL